MNEMDAPDINGLSPADAVHNLGLYIDEAADFGDEEKARNAISLCDALGDRVAGDERIELCYFRANAWSVIRNIKHRLDESAIWQWDQEELLQEVYWLRSAIRSEGFSDIHALRQAQILVNAGNALNHIGRPVEAIEYWKRALVVLPEFAMARGNLGLGLAGYARMLYDSGHAVVVLKNGYDRLISVDGDGAIWEAPGFEAVKSQMLSQANFLARYIDFDGYKSIRLEGFSLGKTKSERCYRSWVLDAGLFLNPLNDVGPHTIAARDILHLPSMC